MPSYTRDTELRSVEPNDLYHLAVILDENNYWRKLMEIIPREINNQLYGACPGPTNVQSASPTNGRKYERDHIRLIENAFKRSGESRLCPQILFDEWGSSGRKHERPTLGVLLHLLLQAQLFRAADYVADALLKETKPTRPSDGPGAEISCDLPTSFFNDIDNMANDSENYPNTELLQLNANCGNSLMDNNKDYYTKYREPSDKYFVSSTTMSIQNDGAPIPPPRLQKSARLLKRQQQSQQSDHLPMYTNRPNNHNIYTINEHESQNRAAMNNEGNSAKAAATNNIPKISLLMNATSSEMEESTGKSLPAYGDSLPNLSFLQGQSERNIQVSYDINGSNSILNIINTNNIDAIRSTTNTNYDALSNQYLPAISALNLNGERDSNEKYVPSSAALSYVVNTESSNAEIGFNVPSIVTNICKDENSERDDVDAIETDINTGNIPMDANVVDVVDDYAGNDYRDDIEEDDEDVPNLSIFNDSSLTNVTNTSGDNIFDQSVNDSRPTSTDSVPPPNVFH